MEVMFVILASAAGMGLVLAGYFLGNAKGFREGLMVGNTLKTCERFLDQDARGKIRRQYAEPSVN